MRTLLRQMIPIGLVLAIPIVPFLFMGDWVEDWISDVEQSPWYPAIVILLLSGDIFLPIPSSVVSTYTGGQLNWFTGTLVSWSGMTIGATLGFALSRQYGRVFALRFSSQQELSRAGELADRFGPGFLILARGVPVVAEASVLLMGIHGLSWGRFLGPIVFSNLGISLGYSAFGHIAREHDWFPLALGVSIGVPIVLTLVVQRLFQHPRVESRSLDDGDDSQPEKF